MRPAIKYGSHPVWVRGLKQCSLLAHRNLRLSHPVWVRGLKHDGVSYDQFYNVVAPRVGAWIETEDCTILFNKRAGRTPCGCVD